MPSLTETQIHTITQFVLDDLGQEATYERVHQVVRSVVERFERSSSSAPQTEVGKRFLVICLSATGEKNEQALEQGLKDSGCQIKEHFDHQLGAFHVLIAAVERSETGMSYEQIRARLAGAGVQTGVKLILQTEDVLRK